MKTRIQGTRVLAAAVLCGGALWYAYHVGYSRGHSCGCSQGSREERDAWIVLSTTSEALSRGDVLAHRAPGKLLLASKINRRTISAVNNVNSAMNHSRPLPTSGQLGSPRETGRGCSAAKEGSVSRMENGAARAQESLLGMPEVPIKRS